MFSIESIICFAVVGLIAFNLVGFSITTLFNRSVVVHEVFFTFVVAVGAGFFIISPFINGFRTLFLIPIKDFGIPDPPSFLVTFVAYMVVMLAIYIPGLASLYAIELLKVRKNARKSKVGTEAFDRALKAISGLIVWCIVALALGFSPEIYLRMGWPTDELAFGLTWVGFAIIGMAWAYAASTYSKDQDIANLSRSLYQSR